MNKIKNQRGFATFEILLVAASLAILSTVALPNMERILDKVRLDYELKHLYSDLNFAQDLGRSVDYNPTSIGGGSYTREKIFFRLNYSRKTTEIHRTFDGNSDLIFNEHELSDRITFSNNTGIKDLSVGDSYTINLKSKSGDSAEIKLDSVGRIRGARTK